MTRYKPVPPARSPTDLAEVRAALPLVPGGVEDCCRRLQERADVPSREVARDWLPFLVALGLAGEDDGAYYRTREALDRERLAGRFREHVLGAREVLDALADGPLSATGVFERTTDVVPRWERQRDPEWEAVWQERTERLLAWAVVFGLCDREGERYRLTGNGT